jgi:pyridoxine 5-phosphate synthase
LSLIKLSVNVNKVATIRNSRGGAVPSVLDAVRVCVEAGAPGITVHPRADARHITTADVHEIAAYLKPMKGRVEFNIEGDPRPSCCSSCTRSTRISARSFPSSRARLRVRRDGPPETPHDVLARTVSELRSDGIRVSLFVDPQEASIRWAAEMGADRVELYTEPFARAFERGHTDARDSFAGYARAADAAYSLGVGVNAGHDLDLDNLVLFRRLPHLDEVSIGHALISHAVFVGLAKSVREFLDVLAA